MKLSYIEFKTSFSSSQYSSNAFSSLDILSISLKKCRWLSSNLFCILASFCLNCSSSFRFFRSSSSASSSSQLGVVGFELFKFSFSSFCPVVGAPVGEPEEDAGGEDFMLPVSAVAISESDYENLSRQYTISDWL